MADERLEALERLADLKQSGALTDDEAETEKRRILSSDFESGPSSAIAALPPPGHHKGQTSSSWTDKLWHRVDPNEYSGSSRVAIWTSVRIQGYGILSIVAAFISALVSFAVGPQVLVIAFTCLIQGFAMVMLAAYIQVRVSSTEKLELLLTELVRNTTPR